MWTGRKRLLFCALLVLWVSLCGAFSQETFEDYWESQRQYYQQYSAWELPTEAIVEWLNQLEQSEKDLTLAQETSSEALTLSREALSILNPLKEASEKASRLLEQQQSQLALQSTLTVVILVGITILLFLK